MLNQQQCSQVSHDQHSKMYHWNLLLSIVLVSFHGITRSNSEGVKISDYPYHVSVEYNNEHKCSGAFVTERWILTVAACVFRTGSNPATKAWRPTLSQCWPLQNLPVLTIWPKPHNQVSLSGARALLGQSWRANTSNYNRYWPRGRNGESVSKTQSLRGHSGIILVGRIGPALQAKHWANGIIPAYYRNSASTGNRSWTGVSNVGGSTGPTLRLCDGLTDLTVRLATRISSSDGDQGEVRSVVIHEDFDPVTYDYDIALLNLKVPLDYGNGKLPIMLQPSDYEIPDGSLALLTGWPTDAVRKGNAGSELTVVSLPVVNQTVCNESLPVFKELTDSMLCAGYMRTGTEVCQGDSGSPLVYEERLVGLLSYGLGCTVSTYPSVYTRITSFVPWILSHTGVMLY